MTAEQFIKAQLVSLAYREAGHCGGLNNMLAVLYVLRNRRYAGWFGGDWMSIIEHHAEVSAHGAGTQEAPNLRDLDFRSLLHWVDDIFNGMAVDQMTEGALYYAELNRVDREWFKKNIAGKLEEHQMCATIGPMTFFK